LNDEKWSAADWQLFSSRRGRENLNGWLVSRNEKSACHDRKWRAAARQFDGLNWPIAECLVRSGDLVIADIPAVSASNQLQRLSDLRHSGNSVPKLAVPNLSGAQVTVRPISVVPRCGDRA
jgi:hypothetical protein